MKKSKTDVKDEASIGYLCDAIEKWINANQNKERIVEFYGGFWIVDPEKEFDVVEDRAFAYGSKETLLMSIQEMAKSLVDEKEDFINW